MIDRINDSLARHFGGVGTTKASLIRIMVWLVVFLVLLSSFATTHDESDAARALRGPVQILNRPSADQRGFAPSPFGKREFHIAWIFSSEGYVAKGNGAPLSMVAYDVQKSLPEIGGRKVVIDVYGFLGMGLGDLHLALMDALAAKPDLVLLSLNPVWAMNPVALHRVPELDARGAMAIAERPRDWPEGAALFSPSDLLWGLTQSKLTPVRERAYWSKEFHDLVDDLGPLDRSKLAEGALAHPPDETQKMLNTAAVTFWLKHRLGVLPDGGTARVEKDDWIRWINLSNRGDNQANARVLRAIGSELRESKIPSVVYLAQTNTTWASDPAFTEAVAGVEGQLRELAGSFRSRNILYEPRQMGRFVSGLVFSDAVHVTNPGTIGAHLATQVCSVLDRVGRGTGCRPLVGGSNGG